MGLYHSTYLVYGVEIPATTDFDRLDQVLAEQPDNGTVPRVEHTYLGDFQRLFLHTVCEEVEENTATVVGPHAYTRHEIPAWNAALHLMASRLGNARHELPRWLVLHNHS
jgi:hypothetical protein